MASNGVNVKMGVSGVAQFKQNMNTAKQAVKTLDAQLALSEKQFKQTGDSQSYMAEKSALLEAKLENQKKVLENAERALRDMTEKGVDRGSKAYQDMYRAMIEAKGAIIDTESAMNGITEAGDAASDGVSEMNNQLKNIGKGVGYENVTNGISKITGAMEKALKGAIDLGKAIVREVLGAGSWADDLGTRAKFYQISEEELQRMEKTAALIDTPVEAIVNAKKKLKKELAGQAQGDMGAWAALGINPNDAKDADDLLWRTGEAIMKLKDESEQEYYAQQLLGRSWNELIPLFETGRKEYEELNESWNVVPEKQVKALQEMDDQYQILQGEFETLKRTVAGAFAEPLTKAMEILTNLMQKFNEYLASTEGQAAMEALGDAVTKLVEDLVNVDPDAVVNGIAKAIDDIKEGFVWIKDNKDKIKSALEVIGIAFAGLEIVKIATSMSSFVANLALVRGVEGNPTTLPPTTAPPTTVPPAAAPTTGTTTGTTVATATGSGIGAKILSGVKSAAMIGAELLPVLAVVDTVMKLNDFTKEGLEKGQASMDKFAAMREAYGNEEWFSTYSDLYGYQHIRGHENPEAGFEGMERFSERWQQWRYDDLYDPLLDKMWELMDPEQADRFDTAMDLFSRNPNLGYEEMQEQIWNPLQEGLDVMEQAAEELSGEGADKVKDAGDGISDAAKEMGKLPGETADAVKEALNGTQVVIDGNALTAVVGEIMANWVARNGGV